VTTSVLLAGWGIETRSWAAHGVQGETLFLVGPSEPPDLDPSVTYLGPVVPTDCRPDRILRSPGFRPHDQVISDLVLAGVPTTTPTGDWFARRPDAGRIVALTGSKAKSSTSSLVGVALRRAGVAQRVVGNIGTSVWDPADRITDSDGVTVVEVSSYQCHDLPAGADLAAITFLAVDHLDWHGTVEAYHAAKLRLFQLTSPRPCLTGAASVVASARALGVEATLVDADSTNPRRQNATLAAAIVGHVLGHAGADVERLRDELLDDYPVLPGRLATIGWVGRCEIIDDSLGSNPAATTAALASVAGRRAVWLMGGATRGVSLEPLVEPAARLISDGGTIMTFGVTGGILRDLLRGPRFDGSVVAVTDLEAAIAAGFETDPEVMLFSPSGPTPPDEGTWKDRSARLAAAAIARGMTSSRP